MIYWFKQLSNKNIDFSNWNPFIRSTWFRDNYMKVVYVIMGIFILSMYILGNHTFVNVIINTFSNLSDHAAIRVVITMAYLLIVYGIIFVVHELLHIAVVYKLDDISLTCRGLFCWLNTNAVLTKLQFWFFMTLPILGLTVIPFIASLFLKGYIKSLLLYIGWINLIVASSDFINSILIIIKPKGALFCRGYYQYKDRNRGKQ